MAWAFLRLPVRRERLAGDDEEKKHEQSVAVAPTAVGIGVVLRGLQPARDGPPPPAARIGEGAAARRSGHLDAPRGEGIERAEEAVSRRCHGDRDDLQQVAVPDNVLLVQEGEGRGGVGDGRVHQSAALWEA